jgi:hypothetical protein
LRTSCGCVGLLSHLPHQESKQDLGRRKAALPHLSRPLKAQGADPNSLNVAVLRPRRPQIIPSSCLLVAWITELSHQFRQIYCIHHEQEIKNIQYFSAIWLLLWPCLAYTRLKEPEAYHAAALTLQHCF